MRAEQADQKVGSESSARTYIAIHAHCLDQKPNSEDFSFSLFNHQLACGFLKCINHLLYCSFHEPSNSERKMAVS